MNCDRFQEALSAQLDGHLEETQAELLNAHLSECRSCRGQAREMRQVLGLLQSLPELEAPASMRQKAAEKLVALGEARPIPCDDALSLVSEEMDEPLPAAEGFALRRHLSKCAPCQAESAALRATISALASLPEAAPPRSVREAALMKAAVRVPPRAQRSRLWAAATGAVGIAAAIVLASLVMVKRPAPISAPPAAPAERTIRSEAAAQQPAPAAVSAIAQPAPAAESPVVARRIWRRSDRARPIQASIVPRAISQGTRIVSEILARVPAAIAPRRPEETAPAAEPSRESLPSAPSPPVAYPEGAAPPTSESESPPVPPEAPVAARGELLPGPPASASAEPAKQVLADLKRSLSRKPAPIEVIRIEKNQPAFINVAVWKRRVD